MRTIWGWYDQVYTFYNMHYQFMKFWNLEWRNIIWWNYLAFAWTFDKIIFLLIHYVVTDSANFALQSVNHTAEYFAICVVGSCMFYYINIYGLKTILVCLNSLLKYATITFHSIPRKPLYAYFMHTKSNWGDYIAF